MSSPPERLRRSTTALLVIDLQEKLLPTVLDAGPLIDATRLCLRAAQVLGLTVITTTQYQRGLGPIIEPVEELLPPAARRIDKIAFSCFDDASFRTELSALQPGVETLLVAGIEAHICVAGTVLEARRHGLSVHAVRDAVSARKQTDLEVGLKRMETAGAVISSSEMAIYELLGQSGTSEFKALLPYLRDGA